MRVDKWPFLSGSILSGFTAACEAKADQQRPIDVSHGFRGKDADNTSTSLQVDSSNLIAKSDTVLSNSAIASFHEDVDRRRTAEVSSGSQRNHYGHGRKAVACIILNDDAGA
jgi:hypothetical protein